MDLTKEQLNNEIVCLKKVIKRSRLYLINKLSKKANLLKKSNRNNNAKLEAKRSRLLVEIAEIKAINIDKSARFSLVNTDSLEDIVRKGGSIQERNLARLANHQFVKEAVAVIRNKYPKWETQIPTLYRIWQFNQKMFKKPKKTKKPVNASKSHDVYKKELPDSYDLIESSNQDSADQSVTSDFFVPIEDDQDSVSVGSSVSSAKQAFANVISEKNSPKISKKGQITNNQECVEVENAIGADTTKIDSRLVAKRRAFGSLDTIEDNDQDFVSKDETVANFVQKKNSLPLTRKRASDFFIPIDDNGFTELLVDADTSMKISPTVSKKKRSSDALKNKVDILVSNQVSASEDVLVTDSVKQPIVSGSKRPVAACSEDKVQVPLKQLVKELKQSTEIEAEKCSGEMQVKRVRLEDFKDEIKIKPNKSTPNNDATKWLETEKVNKPKSSFFLGLDDPDPPSMELKKWDDNSSGAESKRYPRKDGFKSKFAKSTKGPNRRERRRMKFQMPSPKSRNAKSGFGNAKQAEPEMLHPSWAAKRKQNSVQIASFEGTKIKFDDD